MTIPDSPALDLDALTALERAATPAPWRAHHDEGHLSAVWFTPYSCYVDITPAHADLIVAMRNQLPALLSELAAARAERDQARSEVKILTNTEGGRLFVAEQKLAEAREQAKQAQAELAKTRAELADAEAALRDADTWIERVGMATEAVIILAENKTPGLMLLADLALWNNRRRELLVDATSAAAPKADERKPTRCPVLHPDGVTRCHDNAGHKGDEHGGTGPDGPKTWTLPSAAPDPADEARLERCCRVAAHGPHVHGDADRMAYCDGAGWVAAGGGEQLCGHQYVGDKGEAACDRYTHADDRHWNSLAEFGWTSGGEVTP